MSHHKSCLDGDLLSALANSEIKQLLFIGKIQSFIKNEFIFQAAKSNNSIHIIIEGQAKIFQTSSIGKEIILWFCLPGEIFGLAECLNGHSKKVFAQACTNTKILTIPDQDFKQFIIDHSHIAMKIISLLSNRMQILSNTLLTIATEDVDSRIKYILHRLATCYGFHLGNIIKIDFKITHQEIANMIGASRQTVTSAINRLKNNGYLYVESHKIYLFSDKWEINLPQRKSYIPHIDKISSKTPFQSVLMSSS